MTPEQFETACVRRAEEGARHQIMQYNRLIAWHALQNLLLCVGGVSIVSYAAAVPWFLDVIGAVAMGTVFVVLYHLEISRVNVGAPTRKDSPTT